MTLSVLDVAAVVSFRADGQECNTKHNWVILKHDVMRMSSVLFSV